MDIIGQNGNDGDHYDETKASGYTLENNIDFVKHKSPRYWTVVLKSGGVVTVPKAEAQKYLTKDPDSPKSYM